MPTERGTVFARVGGSGPPILLLHGYPQTHLMWHTVAPTLAGRFTVVAADLPGYGESFRPVPAAGPPAARQAGARARTSCRRCGRSATTGSWSPATTAAGGSRTGWPWTTRTRVLAAAAFDVVPTGEVWARADAATALAYWHWGFLAQPAPLPERMIAADPDAFFDLHVRRLGLGRATGRYPDALMAAYRAHPRRRHGGRGHLRGLPGRGERRPR